MFLDGPNSSVIFDKVKDSIVGACFYHEGKGTGEDKGAGKREREVRVSAKLA
jgi:hypothetical protein